MEAPQLNLKTIVEELIAGKAYYEAIEVLTKLREDAKTGANAEIYSKTCICHCGLMNFSAASRNLNNWKERAGENVDWAYWELKICLGLGVRIPILKAEEFLMSNLEKLSSEALKTDANKLLERLAKTWSSFQQEKMTTSSVTVDNGLKIEWNQDSHFVVLSFTDVSDDPMGAKPWDVTKTLVDFSGRKLDLKLNGVTAKVYDLFGEISPKESFYDFKYDNKVLVINLGKNIKKLSWTNWQLDTKGKTPIYPSSSKEQKNWDKIDKDIEIERKQNKEYDCEGTMHFFKEIFGNADPEAQKAMMKSYQTSGGTVL